jgi:hypothetical protein
MQAKKEEARPDHTITVITKKRRGIYSPARTSSHTIETHQPNILGSANRFVRDELRIFGDR